MDALIFYVDQIVKRNPVANATGLYQTIRKPIPAIVTPVNREITRRPA